MLLFYVLLKVSTQPRSVAWAAFVATGILASSASPAQAGSIHGRVVVAGAQENMQSAQLDPYPGMLGSVGVTPEAAADPREVVIYVEHVSAASLPGQELPRPKLTQINQSFQPRVLGVPVGTTVDFPNEDLIFHNVFSYSKSKRFDLGYYGKGKSKSVLFDKPGLVKVFCDIHSNMAAYVYVVESPFVTQPDSDGNYVLDGVPSGTRTVKVWHPVRGTQSHTVTVAEEAVRLDIHL